MTRYWPIDDGTAPDTMAAIAIAAGNGPGAINGFGSQGLSLLDSACTPSAADWCNEFDTYYQRGMPLELQQIAISNPDVNPCTTSLCGTPPKVSGDMRQWLYLLAITNHATVIEVYYQDLGLAFDPTYCTSSTSCYHLPTITPPVNPYTWYCEVGYGASSGSCGTGCTAGGCYSDAVIKAHGPQQ